MGKLILLSSLLVALASCNKGKNMTANHQASSTRTSPPYPSVEEETLKGIVRTRFDSPRPTKAQLSRRARNNKVIRELGLPILEGLPVIEDETSIQLRHPREVAERCLATTLCALKGETNDQSLIDSLIEDYSAVSYFSPNERQFLENPAPSKQNLIDFCWRYECVHVFLWALRARDSLAAPNIVCSVPDDMKLIKLAGPATFVANARLRSASEILDMADLYYRLDWAAIELRLKGQTSKKLDEGIIRERHRALNWLIRYMHQEWDDVATDT